MLAHRMVCTPISRTKTQVQVVTNVDPKVVLPYWIINATTTKFAHMMFNVRLFVCCVLVGLNRACSLSRSF